jgi:hypothetical protein
MGRSWLAFNGTAEAVPFPFAVKARVFQQAAPFPKPFHEIALDFAASAELCSAWTGEGAHPYTIKGASLLLRADN